MHQLNDVDILNKLEVSVLFFGVSFRLFCSFLACWSRRNFWTNLWYKEGVLRVSSERRSAFWRTTEIIRLKTFWNYSMIDRAIRVFRECMKVLDTVINVCVCVCSTWKKSGFTANLTEKVNEQTRKWKREQRNKTNRQTNKQTNKQNKPNQTEVVSERRPRCWWFTWSDNNIKFTWNWPKLNNKKKQVSLQRCAKIEFSFLRSDFAEGIACYTTLLANLWALPCFYFMLKCSVLQQKKPADMPETLRRTRRGCRISQKIRRFG